MPPFIANPPQEASANGAKFVGDGWFPEIDLNNARDAMRVGTTITDTRLLAALGNAWNHISNELWAWRTVHENNGIGHLSDVSTRMIGTQSRLEYLFIQAVHASAQSELYDHYSDISATGKNEDAADNKRMSANDFRRIAVHAVRDILGKNRTKSSLI